MKEKRNLEFRSSVVFKETVRKLQAKKLNLDKVFNDSTGKVKIEVMDREFPAGFPGHPEQQLPNALNDVTIQIIDSLRNAEMALREGLPQDSVLLLIPGKIKTNMVISMGESFTKDSINKGATFERKGPRGEFFRFLYNVDSLQDSLLMFWHIFNRSQFQKPKKRTKLVK